MSDSQSEVGSSEHAGGDRGIEQEAKDEMPAPDAQDVEQDEPATAPAEDEDDQSEADRGQESGQESRISGVLGEESAASTEHSSRGDLGGDEAKEDDGEEKGEKDDVGKGDSGESEEEKSEEVEEGEGTKEEEVRDVNKGDGEEVGVVGEERGEGVVIEEEGEREEHGDAVGEGNDESGQSKDEKQSEEEEQQTEEQEKKADLHEDEVQEDRVNVTEVLESLDSSMAVIAESDEYEEDDVAEGEGLPAVEDPVEPVQFVLRKPPEDDFNLEPEFDENEMLFAASTESARSFVTWASDTKNEAVDDEVLEAQTKVLPVMDREKYYELCRAQQAQHSALRRKNAVLQRKMMTHCKRRKPKDLFGEEETTSEALQARYARKLSQFGQAQQEDADTRRLAALADDALAASNARLDAELRALLDALVEHERETCATLLSSKTGKPLSERVVERLLLRQRDAVDAGAATRRAYIKRGARVRDVENAILALEDLGEDLKLVDYEQLRMENQNLIEKLEERDDELARFRARGLHSVQAMSHYRQKAVDVMDACELQLEKLKRGQAALDVARTELNTLKATRDRLRAEFSRESEQSGLLTKPQLLRDFEHTLDECEALRAQLAKLRAEIALEQRQLAAIRALDSGPVSRQAIEPRITYMGSVKLRAQQRRAQHAANRLTAQHAANKFAGQCADKELYENIASAFV